MTHFYTKSEMLSTLRDDVLLFCFLPSVLPTLRDALKTVQILRRWKYEGRFVFDRLILNETKKRRFLVNGEV